MNGSLGKVVGYCKAIEAYESDNIYVGVRADLNSLSRKGGRKRKGSTSKKEQEELDKWLSDTRRRWPIVRFFRGSSRDETVDVLCVPHIFTAMSPSGVPEAYRTQVSFYIVYTSDPCRVTFIQQVPLTLGYAYSIHKAQGQTLERVRIDLAQAFADGQCKYIPHRQEVHSRYLACIPAM